MDSELTPQEETFVTEYLLDFHKQAAALLAGYDSNISPDSILSHPRIQQAIQKRMAERRSYGQKVRDRMHQELENLAFFDPQPGFTATMAVKPLHEWPEALRRCIKRIHIREYRDGGREIKIEWQDKTKAMELFGKLLKLFDSAPDHSQYHLSIHLHDTPQVYEDKPQELIEFGGLTMHLPEE